MLFKLAYLIPTVASMALFTYLMIGISIHLFTLYRDALRNQPAPARRVRRQAKVSQVSVKIDAIPAT
jgi:hypothetical protein